MTGPIPAILAVVDTHTPTLPSSTLTSGAREAMGGLAAVFAAVFAVVGLFLLWAIFIRKPSKDVRRGALSEGGTGRKSSGKGDRRRRRSSKERPRNPTLAETGGLPPRGAGDINAKST